MDGPDPEEATILAIAVMAAAILRPVRSGFLLNADQECIEDMPTAVEIVEAVKIAKRILIEVRRTRTDNPRCV